MSYSPYIALRAFLLAFIFFTMGCTQQHTVQVNKNSLVFTYTDAEANEIIFSSSMDNFQYHSAIKGPGNQWQVTVPINKEFTYFFIVDGMITLPDCPNTVFDDFGTKNCLYVSRM